DFRINTRRGRICVNRHEIGRDVELIDAEVAHICVLQNEPIARSKFQDRIWALLFEGIYDCLRRPEMKRAEVYGVLCEEVLDRIDPVPFHDHELVCSQPAIEVIISPTAEQ